MKPLEAIQFHSHAKLYTDNILLTRYHCYMVFWYCTNNEMFLLEAEKLKRQLEAEGVRF